jgi:putative hydrolase of the HAD superfamily
MPTPLEAVIFDLFYTLIDMRRVTAGASTSEMLGIDSQVWNRKVMEESPHHALGTERDPVESVRQIAHAIDPTIPLARIREAAAVRPARFREALLRIEPEVLAGLAQLRSLGLKLGLISNAGLDEIAAWDESPLAACFDRACFSCHEQLMKPEAAIYLRAAEQLGTRPERCLYVGDGGSQEHEGANAVGMHTVLFLGRLRETYPETAMRRARVTRWVAEGFAELVTLAAELKRTGFPEMKAGTETR